MKNNFKCFLGAFLILSHALFASDSAGYGLPLNNCYSYVKMGVGIPSIENRSISRLHLGIGTRLKRHVTAIDSSITTTLYSISNFNQNPIYDLLPAVNIEATEMLLFYPVFKSGFYLASGISAAGTLFYINNTFKTSPLIGNAKAAFGIELQKNKFLQLELSYPLCVTDFKRYSFLGKAEDFKEILYSSQIQLVLAF